MSDSPCCFFRSTHVPVGDDQRQHLELCRSIAHTFNGRYGKVFLQPEAVFTDTARVYSLMDPQKKMSKSEKSDRSRINLMDHPDVIMKKIRGAKSDSIAGTGGNLQERPATQRLVQLYSAVSGESEEAIAERYENKETLALKLDLAESIIEMLQPFQANYARWVTSPHDLQLVLEEGANRAQPLAENTLERVHRVMGLP